MSDLIEKQAVIDALLSKMDTIDDKPDVVLGMAVTAGMIKDMPSALDQEPCTDAISRQAVIEAIRKCHCEEWIKADIGASIEALSPVTPLEKVGHWEQFGNSWEDKFKCSECGKEQPKILCGERIIGHWSDYCPNCGAKMEVEG